MADVLVPAKAGNFAANGTAIMDIVGVLGGARVSNTVYFWGDFGGGAVAIEITPDGVNWFPHEETVNAANFFTFSSRFLQARLKLTGSAAPNINWLVL